MVKNKNICKDCIWFTSPQGEAGLTCRERSGVSSNTKACKDFTKPPFNLVEVKKTDLFFVKIREKLQNSKFILDPSVQEELTSYFVVSASAKEGGEKLRAIPICSYSFKEASQLASLFEKTQALRDRTLSIKLGALSTMAELRTIEAVGQRYIYEHYDIHLQAMKTTALRDIAQDILLEPLSDKIREVALVIKSADLVYENLKDTYFILKEVKEIACAFLASTRLAGP